MLIFIRRRRKQQILPIQQEPPQEIERNPTILLRRTLQEPLNEGLLQANGRLQPPQRENLISVLGFTQSGIELRIADTSIIRNFSWDFTRRYTGNVFDSFDRAGGVEPDVSDS